MQDLDCEPVEESFLPAGTVLMKGEALTLLMAYVTDLAGIGLEAAGYSRYVRRRFTRPVWEPKRERWCDEQMKKYLLRAQVVADAFSGRWGSGIPLEEVRQVIDAVRQAEIPDWLVEPVGVAEPIAAGHARMERDVQHRFIAVVVDVGAGTTDLAAFGGIQADGSINVTRAVPWGKALSLTLAGDRLDEILQKQILRGVSEEDRSDVLEREAEGQIRSWKETLFTEGVFQPTFTGGVIGPKIDLRRFVELSEIRSFEREIDAGITEVLTSVSSLADTFAASVHHPLSEIALLPSGGGARLPMIQRLAGVNRRVGSYQFHVTESAEAPSWFARIPA